MTEEGGYRALVVDSGPIIRHTGISSLRNRAQTYYTVPAVLQEIRDAKARQHLEQLPFDIITREASPEGIQAVIDFSRQTGDYPSLSAVDLQILGLLYDLECEGCDDISHIRRTPKRKVGVGRVQAMGGAKPSTTEADKSGGINSTTTSSQGDTVPQDGTSFFEGKDVDIVDEDSEEDEDDDEESESPSASTGPKSWAMLVNPAAAFAQPVPELAEQALTVPFGQMKLKEEGTAGVDGGQFSDAEEDETFDPSQSQEDEDESDDDAYANSDADISDEECDVYILDPEEVDERKRAQEEAAAQELEKELVSDFPSLAASLTVEYEGDDNEEATTEEMTAAILAKQKAEQKREESLLPKTNSGKLYNSFRKYGEVIKPKEAKPEQEAIQEEAVVEESTESVAEETTRTDNTSRIIGGSGMSGQGFEVEDDGEGWITSTKDIKKMKAVGRLQPTVSPADVDATNKRSSKRPAGPPMAHRTACATTDFAMQNVILQMNLELLSVDGMKVRRLKSWVSRCGACFTVFSNNASTGPIDSKRLFCARCGSDMMQRVACSVDSKTGRLRLHLSKKYKTSTRGTKFSLPKAGTNNRFQGDLLLREDQLLMGAWNQK